MCSGSDICSWTAWRITCSASVRRTSVLFSQASLRGNAVAIKREIPQTSVRWVQGVVVFWNDFDPGVLDAGNPMYVSGERLRDWAPAAGLLLVFLSAERSPSALHDAAQELILGLDESVGHIHRGVHDLSPAGWTLAVR